jgi:[ribosomal protein S18]-alanine N-acetyltransferase
MEIRKAQEKDFLSLLELEKACFSCPYNEDQMNYELYENPCSKIYVVVDEEKVVGYIDFWITFDSATIARIAIDKIYRNRGLAGDLLVKSEEILKEEHVEFYTLEVRKSNVAAIALYKKHGFALITVKHRYYENGEDALYMMKGEI